MKRFIFFYIALLGISFSLIAQVPAPRRTNSTTNNDVSGASWTKTNDYDFTLRDQNGNLLSNTKDLLYLSTDTLGVLDKSTRTIYLLADFKNASQGTSGKAVILSKYMGKDFYFTNKYSFGTYIGDEFYKGVYSNIDGSYVYYLEEKDATFYFEGIRKFDHWGAKNISKMEYTSTQTYWYRDVAKERYGIIKKGKAINYDEATTEESGNDLIVSMNGIKTYTLEGYYTMASFVFKPVKMYTGSSNSTDTKCVSGNCNDGWGKYEYDNGYYDGFWKNSKKQGYGLYKWTESGGKYIGNWDDDTMSGYGVYIAENDDNIIGHYENGELNGLGLTVYGEDWSYGYFTDGSLTTEYDFYTNNVDTGCSAGDCENKYGRWKWSNGDSFTGFFRNGSLYMGSYNFAGGGKYSGMFNSDNQFHGTGRYFYADGAYYGGQWNDGEMQGRGYYHNKDLEQQIGVWDNSQLIRSLKD